MKAIIFKFFNIIYKYTLLYGSYGLERHMRLELTTLAWRANMLPLHQWRIRRTEARLKEGGIYITFILYQIFFQLSNFLKRTLAVLYRQCLLRSRGTCIAHYACRTFSRFSYPHQSLSVQCPRVSSPQPKL